VSTRFLSQWAGGRARTAGSGAGPGVDEHAAADPAAGLEHQQQILLGALQHAQGAAVSYAELRNAGVEFPAAVVSELVLAGVPIERCAQVSADGARAVGVRLLAPDPVSTETPAIDQAPAPPLNSAPSPSPVRSRDPAPSAGSTNSAPANGQGRPQPVPAEPATDHGRPEARSVEPGWHTIRVYRPSLGRSLGLAVLRPISALPNNRRRVAREVRTVPRRSTLRLAAPLAFLVMLGVIAVVLIITLTGGTRPQRRPVVQVHRARATATRPASRPRFTTATPVTTTTATAATAAAAPAAAAATTTTTTGVATRSAPTPVSPALASQLESRGHSLLEEGQDAAAVPVLQTAVSATGESLGACVEPTTSTCLTYAYALYDLGRALRLSGDAAAAVPILERRLQIDNQRPTVEAELQLAR
jgi:hypothetical protein